MIIDKNDYILNNKLDFNHIYKINPSPIKLNTILNIVFAQLNLAGGCFVKDLSENDDTGFNPLKGYYHVVGSEIAYDKYTPCGVNVILRSLENKDQSKNTIRLYPFQLFKDDFKTSLSPMLISDLKSSRIVIDQMLWHNEFKFDIPADIFEKIIDKINSNEDDLFRRICLCLNFKLQYTTIRATKDSPKNAKEARNMIKKSDILFDQNELKGIFRFRKNNIVRRNPNGR